MQQRQQQQKQQRVQTPLKSWIFQASLYAIAQIAFITARIIAYLTSFIVDRPCCNGLVEAALKQIKDSLLCVHVVIKTLKLIWKFHIVIWQSMSKNCTKVNGACVAQSFFLIQPIRSLFFGIVTGLLIFCDVAISHNWPQIATFRIIRQKSHNSGKIQAKFQERTSKYLLLT